MKSKNKLLKLTKGIACYIYIYIYISMQSLKDDLKCFDLWDKYVSTGHSLKDLVMDRDEWRKLINKKAQYFQLNWQNKRIQRSQDRHLKLLSNS